MKYKELEKYLLVYTDCITVKGAKNATICDFTRNQVEIIPLAYYELLNEFKKAKICRVYDNYNETYHDRIDKFIDFLIEKEYCTFVDDLHLFPDFKKQWISPEKINNAIIDIKNKRFNFEQIITQLDNLNCRLLQLRYYSNLYSISEIKSLLALMKDSSIKGVEILLKYDSTYSESDYIELYEHSILLSSLNIHSAPYDKSIDVHFGNVDKEEAVVKAIKKRIFFNREMIIGSEACGKITKSYFCLNNINDAMHNSCYNSCLNKKISIDENGEIKNCPSFKKTYGNIQNTSLESIFELKDFKELWNITKDTIKVCKDCEFRIICTDCRAFVVDSKDPFSKPQKCTYNPYTGKWNS